MAVAMPVMVLLSLLTTATFRLVLGQRYRMSLTADRVLAKCGAEVALNVAECELSIATEMPTNLGCIAALSRKHIAALEPDSRRGFLMRACGSDISLGLCQPQPDQSLWMLAQLLDATTLAAEINVCLPGTLHTAGRTARYVIKPIPDRRHGQIRHSDDTPPFWLYRATVAEFGADPVVSVVLQIVSRSRVPRHTSMPQTTTEATLSTIRPSSTVTQHVYTTGDQHDTATPRSQTFMFGRLSWRELIEESLR